ncbi:NADPH-dependent FMN reductase [Yinghuangia soli]|uniref:NAD(P)H-dependent oxidoreductase n=1 Tax=Yinghuangia soli TaxID=2908204 RepID=A0AA41PWV5_9ACTN|nr:NAD(P)H-dependent oxidoreductase [Yinghuangia soli]MCF2527393.1 NAD(P)H-dependent oxidoreductase [Yinghuangia soli]
MGTSTTPEDDYPRDMGVETFRLAVIIGSVRAGRHGTVVADWFIRQVEQRDELDIDVIDLAEVDLPFDVGERLPPDTDPTDPAVPFSSAFTVRRRLDAADAYVVVTSEYHHGNLGALRELIAGHCEAWRAKPVGFVSYGGAIGGRRAVEEVRPLFADMHAVPVRGHVALPYAWELFDEQGAPRRPAECAAAAQALLDQLAWWAVTLRRGREARPFAA